MRSRSTRGRDKEQTKRIQELEAEVQRLLDQRRTENFAFLKMAKTGGKEEKDKPTVTIQEDKNEISSCSSDDVASPEEKEKPKAKKSFQDDCCQDAANELDCATDLSKLKEDMDSEIRSRVKRGTGIIEYEEQKVVKKWRRVVVDADELKATLG